MGLPHGDCVGWDIELMTAWAMGSTAAGLAYIGIAVVLFVAYRRFHDLLPYPWTLLIFAAFIAASSSTHLVSVLNLWQSFYWLEAFLRTVTGLLALSAFFTILPFARAVRAAVDGAFPKDDSRG